MCTAEKKIYLLEWYCISLMGLTVKGSDKLRKDSALLKFAASCFSPFL